MTDNKIGLKSISELLEMNFFIPSYQRGYRWTEQQVKDLLDDINNFRVEKIPNIEEQTWYCLQPLVVKHKDGNTWEVIDGQQRLTTIYLILKELNGLLPDSKIQIKYETRTDTKVETITKESVKGNIDEHFMVDALKVISEYSEKGFNKESFLKTLKNHCKVIWYEIGDKESAKKAFKRLNSGKISLSNAELVKALLLQKENFKEVSNDMIQLKQIEMAGEWDRMEQSLNTPVFWYFINPDPENPKYDATRMDFILELILRCQNVNFDEEIKKNQYYTFYEFNKQIAENQNNYIQIWNEIQYTFRAIKSWYDSRELYHYVGYLMNQRGENKQTTLKELLLSSKDNEKPVFLSKIRGRCRNSLDIPKKEIKLDELKYGKDNEMIHNILLLFNIASTQKLNDKSRYPFDLHFQAAKKKWSLEHIHAQNERKAEDAEISFLLDGLKNIIVGKDKKDNINSLISYIEEDKERIKNTDIYQSIIACYMGSEITIETNEDGTRSFTTNFEKDDSLKNMALLQGDKNAKLNNKLYSEKRQIIADYEQNGGHKAEFFVPICTRNVFFKHYSKKSVNPLMWDDNDGTDYLNVIVSSIAKYLDLEEIQNEQKEKIGLKHKQVLQ